MTWNFASWTLWVIPHRMTFLLGWSKSFENICELAIYICNFLGSTLSRHEKTALVQSNFSLNTRLLWHNQVRILYLCTYILGPNLWVSYIQYMETCDFSVFQWLCAHLELECLNQYWGLNHFFCTRWLIPANSKCYLNCIFLLNRKEWKTTEQSLTNQHSNIIIFEISIQP